MPAQSSSSSSFGKKSEASLRSVKSLGKAARQPLFGNAVSPPQLPWQRRDGWQRFRGVHLTLTSRFSSWLPASTKALSFGRVGSRAGENNAPGEEFTDPHVPAPSRTTQLREYSGFWAWSSPHALGPRLSSADKEEPDGR